MQTKENNRLLKFFSFKNILLKLIFYICIFTTLIRKESQAAYTNQMSPDKDTSPAPFFIAIAATQDG